MSSKIKVDTIENVAGSGNVSLGSGHNLVVPGNITGQGTAAITSNATVGGTLGVTGASTLTGNLQMGGTSGVSSSRIVSTIATGNSLEWGHSNAAGYRSTLGALTGGGHPFIAWSGEHGTNSNTYRTRGLKGHVIQTDNAGGLQFKALQTADGDNQTGTITLSIDNLGRVVAPLQPAFNIRHYGASASTSSRTIGNTNSGGTVVEITDVGSHFDTSNGRFTAPVSGTYAFFASTTNGSASNSAVYIYKNGANQLSQTGYHYGVAYNGTAVSAVAVLNANDYAHAIFQPLNNQTDTLYDSGFTGFLIG